jgi:hypothetical protein
VEIREYRLVLCSTETGELRIGEFGRHYMVTEEEVAGRILGDLKR